MTCEAFLGHLFLARDVTHSVHLNTRSYDKHKALNKFYVGIIELADDFAEAYQGRIGLIGPVVLQSATKTNNVIEFLEDSLKKVDPKESKVTDTEGFTKVVKKTKKKKQTTIPTDETTWSDI